MTPMMIAIAMEKKRRKPADAGKGAPAAEASEADAPMMERDDEGGDGGKRNCIYIGGELPDLPAGEITATVKGTVVGEGADRRIEVAEVNGAKVAGEQPEAEDDGGAAMSDALAKEYGGGGGDQEEA